MISVHPYKLALSDQLNQSDNIQALLQSIGFEDWEQAHRRLLRIPKNPAMQQMLARILPHLLTAMSTAAYPDRVLVNFERFVNNAPNPQALLDYLLHNPRGVEMLVILFAGSHFLSEILLRHPEYFEYLTRPRRIAELKSTDALNRELTARLNALMPSVPDPSVVDAVLNSLRRFQRRELLRIGAYDLLDLFDLPTVAGQLSNLADSLVQACLTVAAWQAGVSPDGFAVIGMGKLGGQELNYSSDIDLLFIAADRAGDYLQMAQYLIDALARATHEGFLYRVDMRLRPWGRSGPLVSTLSGHINYLKKHAGLWEKQALLKARVIAGDDTVGQAFLQAAEPLIFNTDGRNLRTGVRAMKERIEAQLRRRGALWGQVKLGEGSIRDIEFVTQYLQLVHGKRHPDLRQRNTLVALAHLTAAQLLPPADYRILADGYIFLRTVEHHLQLMHYHQTHTLPNDATTLNHLARRLRFQGPEAGRQFVDRYDQHSRAVRAVYRRYLEVANDGDLTMTYQNNNSGAAPLKQHVNRMPPTYTITFSEPDIARHFELIERLDKRNLVEIEAEPLDPDAGGDGSRLWQVTIVGYDYVGQLSLICGLLFTYGFDIVEGHVFSYGREQPELKLQPAARRRRRYGRRGRKTGASWRKIVDVFTVRSLHGEASAERWAAYADDLTALTLRLSRGEQREAQGELAKRVAQTMRNFTDDLSTLYPIDIQIDNDISDRHTVLRIDARDTPGFLYELTNALALIGINIRRMTVETEGTQVRDTLYVIDTQNQKITAADQQRKLRVATVLIKEFTHLLPRSPNPEAALLNFRQFIGHLFTRPNWPDELTSLERPEVLQTLARLLGVSEFLWTDFLRMQYANLFPLVSNVDALAERKEKSRLQTELAEALQDAHSPKERRTILNDFKDREMFRIDMRQIQGLITEFGQFSAELTDLAEVVVEAAYQMCLDELQAEYGLPRQPDGALCPMTVCGLGKCGGRELGFASDIELMFIYDGEGRTDGPRQVGTAEFYEKVVQAVNRAIRAKREGIFELDLRLRPYGKAGSMAVSLESFRRYFAPTGDAWPYERQALIKLRPIAGDMRLGEQVVRLRDDLIYTGAPFDAAAMRAMRERQLRHLVTPGAINAKFSPGGLVDVEYLVQGLQITHGHQNPDLRRTNTREAMEALAAAGILSPEEFRQLSQAHIFLRRLINALRMVRGHARDLNVPPAGSEEFEFLARRLNYSGDIAQLHNDLLDHTTTVQELSTKLLEKHAQQ